MESIEEKLSGGHHNSLGRVEEVVQDIMNGRYEIEDLYQTYFSPDELVRLRVSSCMKRISLQKPEWLVPYIDKLLNEISTIDQASTQWTLAILYDKLESFMNEDQKLKALDHMKYNLENHNDWIVLNTTMQTLYDWSKNDTSLKKWLSPRLEKLQNDPRKSISGRAKKFLTKI